MQYSIKQVLSNAADKLNKLGINNPGLDARVLLQHILDKPYEYLLINHDKQLNQLEIEAFEKALARRLNHEPIAYILGVKEFYSREFIVNKHVLIPRADTELLVDVARSLFKKPSLREETVSFDEAIQLKNSDLQNFFITSSVLPRRFAPRNDDSGIHRPIHSRNDEYTEILELGTGSGCITISLLCELQNIIITATDISIEAIRIAKTNASKHQVTDRLNIIQSDWFENIGNGKFDLIVSNPPYIAEIEKPEMAIEAINYEPHLALFAEEDGLEAYKIIAVNAKKFLKQNGKLALEIGFKQEEAVSQIFLDQGYNIEGVYKDLQGHDRVMLFSPISLNRSYARRIGKSLSGLQQNLLDKELPRYLFSKEKLINEKREVFLEIGFGMGEHFINQAKMNPESLFIGVEVYLNGVANVLKLAQEQNTTNFLLFPNNLDFILHDLPNNSLDGIYILFPDPWTKNKQKKKRILNKERLKILQSKLKKNGNLIFASDIENYFNEAVALIKQNGDFQIVNEDNYLKPHDNYIVTKYHQKAVDAGRKPQFMNVRLG